MNLKIPLSAAEQVHLRWFIGIELSSQHWFCIQPCSSNHSPCVVGFTLTRSLAVSCTDGGVCLCRDSRAAAACNMWPRRLPAPPLSIFHYSLFNLSPCCWTAVKPLTAFTSCQEHFFAYSFFHGGGSTGNWIWRGQKTRLSKATPASDWRSSVQVRCVAAFQTIICGIKFPQIRASKTNSRPPL